MQNNIVHKYVPFVQRRNEGGENLSQCDFPAIEVGTNSFMYLVLIRRSIYVEALTDL